MVELIAAWLPLAIIIVVVVIMGRLSMKSYSNHVARVEQINQENTALTREMVAELREIKQLLKDQR